MRVRVAVLYADQLLRRILILGLTLSAIMGVSAPARADDLGIYRLSPEVDLPVTGAILGLTLTSFFVSASSSGCGSCDPLSISGFDRIATERDSTFSRSASDISMYLTMATPLILEAVTIDNPADRPGVLLADSVVIGETFALTMAMTRLLKGSIARPRPGMYRNGEAETDSFPSMHSSMSFASAAAGCSLYVHRENPSFGEGALACSPGFLMATATAAMRVDAGRHFPTDVLAGALLGTAIGLLIPWLHTTF